MMLEAVITFLLSSAVWLLLWSFISYTMTLMTDNMTIYYATNVNLFFMVASFATIFGLIALAIRVVKKRRSVMQ